MYSTIKTCAICGMEPYILQVEIDVAKGLPYFEIVGYLSTEAKEARERIKVALKNSGVLLPPFKITINLSPANIRKAGTLFDLPISIGILQAIGVCNAPIGKEIIFLGELGLKGEVRGGKGILPMLIHAKENGIKTAIVSKENEKEASLVEGLMIIGVESLTQALAFLKLEDTERKKRQVKRIHLKEKERIIQHNFNEVIGQEIAKKVAEIGAAGFHHILLLGPPGVGKTMIAQCIQDILPSLSKEEQIEISKIYSVAGKLNSENPLVIRRPFLNPQRSISMQAFVGGGKYPLPGVLSLSHKGVLFLDEIAEFPRNMIEVLREPLEEKEVQLHRMYGNYTYPADFMLVAAMNSCPCGQYPNLEKCTCTDAQRKKYRGKISGPIMDRIDLCVLLSMPTIYMDGNHRASESSEVIAKRVLKAREIQRQRYKDTDYQYNSQVAGKDLEKYCEIGKEEIKFLQPILAQMDISVRGYHRILKVARTIADLEEKEMISISHLSQAIGFRMKEE